MDFKTIQKNITLMRGDSVDFTFPLHDCLNDFDMSDGIVEFSVYDRKTNIRLLTCNTTHTGTRRVDAFEAEQGKDIDTIVVYLPKSDTIALKPQFSYKYAIFYKKNNRVITLFQGGFFVTLNEHPLEEETDSGSGSGGSTAPPVVTFAWETHDNITQNPFTFNTILPNGVQGIVFRNGAWDLKAQRQQNGSYLFTPNLLPEGEELTLFYPEII